MGASPETVVERGEAEEEKREDVEEKDEIKFLEQVAEINHPNNINPSSHTDFRFARLQNLNPSNPLRIVIQGASTVPTRSPPPPQQVQPHHLQPQAQPHPTPQLQPQPQPSLATLNSRSLTNRISLFLFLLHLISAIALVFFLVFKAVQTLIKPGPSHTREKRVLQFFLPQVSSSALLSILLAFTWQKALRTWPAFMTKFILCTSFFSSLTAGVLLLCFQRAATDGVGVALVAFSVGNGLYACWLTRRVGFAGRVLENSLRPVSKFPGLNCPTYWMMGVGFVWISLWVLAVIGALEFWAPGLVVTGLVLSLAWTAEVLRNVANVTVSRVMALYYLRGMQANTQFCFQRAMTWNLGSACLGSLFLPTIEFLRIIARGLNLLEGEDEFMFSCAHCCLKVMESVFRYGNGWAFVQVAAYGKGFTRASVDTWGLFERQGMEPIVDSDITSAICFLTGVCSGSICVIAMASWTFSVHKTFTATVSLLTFFIGYLMTRIAMALPHACVSCYYVCYAENPTSHLFDDTIRDRINVIKKNPEVLVPTPRVPRRLTTA